MANSALLAQRLVERGLYHVPGTAALAGCAAVLLSPAPAGRGPFLGIGVLFGLLVTTLLIDYPELFIFLVAAFVVHLAAALWRRRLAWKSLLGSVGVALLTSVVLLNE